METYPNPGATGEFPRGKLGKSDEGALTIADITTALIAEFRRIAADKRAQAAAATTSVENFPGVVARDPKAVIALRIAEALERIASDLEAA